MKKEINPRETSRAAAFELWMSSPMPMVSLTKTHHQVLAITPRLNLNSIGLTPCFLLNAVQK